MRSLSCGKHRSIGRGGVRGAGQTQTCPRGGRGAVVSAATGHRHPSATARRWAHRALASRRPGRCPESLRSECGTGRATPLPARRDPSSPASRPPGLARGAGASTSLARNTDHGGGGRSPATMRPHAGQSHAALRRPGRLSVPRAQRVKLLLFSGLFGCRKVLQFHSLCITILFMLKATSVVY